MTYQRYQVTLIDSGTYTIAVAAADATEAVGIARHVLFEKAFAPVPGLTIEKRDAIGEAKPAPETGRPHRFHFRYTCDFSDGLMATDRPEAERFADWLIANRHPLDFDLEDTTIDGVWATEVVS